MAYKVKGPERTQRGADAGLLVNLISETHNVNHFIVMVLPYPTIRLVNIYKLHCMKECCFRSIVQWGDEKGCCDCNTVRQSKHGDMEAVYFFGVFRAVFFFGVFRISSP